jgi:phospholipid-binding lipoprotein MlaA
MLIAGLTPGVCGAAARGAVGHTPGDPWEGFNRKVFKLNLSLDRLLVRPLAMLSTGLTPGPIGKIIHNFVVNLNEPVVIVNDLLQLRPGPAVRSAFRLLVNTTAGGLGAFDVAAGLGDPMHVNGFGDTLGRYGVKPGPYLVLPVLGPSDVRDLFGSVVDDATVPLQTIDYPYRTEVTISVAIIGGLNERQMVAKDLDTLLEDATDPYATLRSSYLQSREAQIRGTRALPVLPDIDEAPASAPPPGQTPPAVETPPVPEAPPADVAPAPQTPSPPSAEMLGLY